MPFKGTRDGGADPFPAGRGARDIEGLIAAGGGGEVESLREILSAAAAEHRLGDEAHRRFIRNRLAHLERVFVENADFAAADAVYRARMDCAAAEAEFSFRDYRRLSSLFRAAGFKLWRFTSWYGTSLIRLGWFTFNVGFYFALVYFGLEVLTFRAAGVPAFKSQFLVSHASFFVIAVQGFFPGTAVFLADTFWAQLLMTLQNIIGAALGLLFFGVAARRAWRGFS